VAYNREGVEQLGYYQRGELDSDDIEEIVRENQIR
jgi:hypothetical protein